MEQFFSDVVQPVSACVWRSRWSLLSSLFWERIWTKNLEVPTDEHCIRGKHMAKRSFQICGSKCSASVDRCGQYAESNEQSYHGLATATVSRNKGLPCASDPSKCWRVDEMEPNLSSIPHSFDPRRATGLKLLSHMFSVTWGIGMASAQNYLGWCPNRFPKCCCGKSQLHSSIFRFVHRCRLTQSVSQSVDNNV